MIDTHAHIYLEQFENDRASIIKNSKKAGVKAIYMPNIDTTTVDNMLAIEKTYPDYCLSMLGLHPCSVKENFEKELKTLKKYLDKIPFIAIGEIGIDLYWDKTFFEQQQQAFIIQSTWAKERNLPVVIHSRNAMSEIIDLLKICKDENYFGVLHCFTGTLEEAHTLIDLGFKLGIGGVATFKKGGLDSVLKNIDLKHIVLETDSPYLSPTPYRGKRNEPSYLPYIVEKIAYFKNSSSEVVIKQTTKNAKILFNVSSV